MNIQDLLFALLVAYLILSGLYWSVKMMDEGAEVADLIGLSGALFALGFMAGRIA